MKIINLTLVFCIWAIGALAQDQPAGKPLLAFQRTNANMEMESAAPHARGVEGTVSQSSTLHYPTINTCLTVYDNGVYIFERVDERSAKPKTKVLQDTLTPEQLQQLQAIVNDQAFRSISSPPVQQLPDEATRLKEGELLTARIYRAEGNQELVFMKRRYSTSGASGLSSGLDSFSSNWEKNDKPMKPFLSWVKDMEKKSQSAAKDGTAGRCVTPEGAF